MSDLERIASVHREVEHSLADFVEMCENLRAVADELDLPFENEVDERVIVALRDAHKRLAAIAELCARTSVSSRSMDYVEVMPKIEAIARGE